MKLVLDEMHAPVIAEALDHDGYDVVAVAASPTLRGMPDDELLAWATDTGRVIVTENVGDYARLASTWTVAGREHAGVIFTHPRRFPRSTQAYPADVVAALQSLLAARPAWGPSTVWWL